MASVRLRTIANPRPVPRTAGRRGVGLGVGFEDLFKPAGGDADARVAYLQPGAQAAALSAELQARVDMSAFGELHRVAEEVGGHAPELDRIAEHGARRVGLDQRGESEAFPAGLRLESGDHFLDRPDGVERDAFERGRSVPLTGEFQHVADDLGEFLRAGPDLAQRSDLVGGRAFEACLAKALDRVDRVADFMRDVGDDLFGPRQGSTQAGEFFQGIFGTRLFFAFGRVLVSWFGVEDEPAFPSGARSHPQGDRRFAPWFVSFGGAKDGKAAPILAPGDATQERRAGLAAAGSFEDPVQAEAGPHLSSQDFFHWRVGEPDFSVEGTDEERSSEELGQRARLCHRSSPWARRWLVTTLLLMGKNHQSPRPSPRGL